MAGAGYYALAHIRVDAIPDIGEKQVLAQVVNIKSVFGPQGDQGGAQSARWLRCHERPRAGRGQRGGRI